MQRKCDKFNENNAPSDTVNKMATKDVNSAAQTAGGLLTNNVFATKSANAPKGSAEAAVESGNRAIGSSAEAAVEGANRPVGNGNWAAGYSNRVIGNGNRVTRSSEGVAKSANGAVESANRAIRNAKLTVGSGGKSAPNVTDQTAGVTPYRSNGMAEPRKRPRTISKAPISSVEPFGDDPLMRGRFVPDEIFGENYGEEYFEDEN